MQYIGLAALFGIYIFQGLKFIVWDMPRNRKREAAKLEEIERIESATRGGFRFFEGDRNMPETDVMNLIKNPSVVGPTNNRFSGNIIGVSGNNANSLSGNSLRTSSSRISGLKLILKKGEEEPTPAQLFVNTASVEN